MDQITDSQLSNLRESFYLRGESVANWARLHQFNKSLVYSVLNGRIKCRRGEAHRIAVALGLKPDVASVPFERQSEVATKYSSANDHLPENIAKNVGEKDM